MIDTKAFAQDFRDRLITVAAESRGLGRMEALRRYHTDVHFHAMVETIVLTAVESLLAIDIGVISTMEPLREEFKDEVANLLGWER